MDTGNSYHGLVPTPEKTSLSEIVAAAGRVLEAKGLSGLTMNEVALEVGVRAPSLYKRLRSREELIRLVAEAAMSDLAARLDSAEAPAALADRFREFGHERPAAFHLIVAPGVGASAPGAPSAAAASAAVLAHASEVAGTDRALDAARTLTAWAAGFITMELGGGFNLGGDVDRAWAFGVRTILAGIAAEHGAEGESGGASASA